MTMAAARRLTPTGYFADVRQTALHVVRTAGGADVTAPNFSSFTIGAAGNVASIVLSEAVTRGANGISGLALTVTSGGAAVTLTYSSGDGTNTLNLTLSRTVGSTETFTIGYIQPGDGIKDAAGNLLADFSGQAVTNSSTVDAVAPTIASGTINAAGTTITFAASETVSIGAGGNGGFTLSMSGGAVTATYSSGSGSSSLVYTLSRTIQQGETGTHSYTQPGNGVEDAAGNDLVSYSGATVTNSSTADTVAPTVSSVVLVSATSLRITFSEPVKFGAGGNGGWAVTLSGGAATLTYASGTTTNTLYYTVSRSVGIAETGTYAYTQPGNGVEDIAGNDLATIASGTVINGTGRKSTMGAPAGGVVRSVIRSVLRWV